VTGHGRVGVLIPYGGVGPKVRALGWTLEQQGTRMVWDSGAWSVFNSGKTIDIDKHAQWVIEQQARGSEARYVGLDVIRNGPASIKNWKYQTRLGAKVEPVMHYGEPLSYLDTYVPNETGWLSLGGLAQRTRGQDLLDGISFFAAVVKATGGAVKLHGMGATHPTLARKIPFDSADSTYWFSGERYGLMPLFDRQIGDFRKYKYKTRHASMRERGWRDVHEDSDWLRKEYDLTPSALFNLTMADSRRVAILSYKRFADWLSDFHEKEVTIYLAGGNDIKPEEVQGL
jgi:hypothetical protein